MLRVAFPSGATEDKLDLFVLHLDKAHVDPVDLGEAVERLLHVRSDPRFPVLSDILVRTREVAHERRTTDVPQLEPGKPRKPTPAQKAELRAYRWLLFSYACFYCHVAREWVRPKERRTGCGCNPPCAGEIPPGAAVAMLARAKSERWSKVARSDYARELGAEKGSWNFAGEAVEELPF